MPQDVERYLYFTVALLKDSAALDALWQDALKYHMIDQPGKLIAMRLTEYYEIKANGIMPHTNDLSNSRSINNGISHESNAIVRNSHFDDDDDADFDDPFDDYDEEPAPVEKPYVEKQYIEKHVPVATSPDVAQNADAAADYWTLL
jgi:hypothetical protein